MGKITGASTTIKIGKESSFGEAANLTLLLPIITESLGDTTETESSEAIFGMRGKKDISKGKISAGGNIDLEMWSNSFGFVFWGLLGKAVLETDKTVITPIDPVSNPSEELPSFTIEKNQGGQKFLYTGSKINSLDLDLTVGQRPKMTLSIESKKETVSAGTESADLKNFGNKFVFKNMIFYKDEFTSAASRWSNMKISVKNNIDTDDYRADGTGERASLDAQNLEVTGSLDVIFDTAAVSGEYTTFKNDSDFSIGAQFENGSGDKYEIFLPKVKFTSLKHETSGKEKITLSGEWEAIIPDDNSAIIKVTDYNNSTGTY